MSTSQPNTQDAAQPGLPESVHGIPLDSPVQPESKAHPDSLVRCQPTGERAEQSLARRRLGSVAMALVALATLMHRRATYDEVFFMLCEAVVCGSAIMAAAWLNHRRTVSSQLAMRRPTSSALANNYGRIDESTQLPRSARFGVKSMLMVGMAVFAPWIVNYAAKRSGPGSGMELVMLGTLAWAGLMVALLSSRSQTISLSVVCSGFVALFSTLISDGVTATWFAYSWVALCMWWLVGNHWEGLDCQAAERIERSLSLRWSFVGLGFLLFAISVFSIGNQVPVLQKLEAGLMPTSGGTRTKDRSARSGVGKGDALVAAKNHAVSFGAVETEVFLDSEKPSLFDVFTDEFGEIRPKDKAIEKAQALAPQDVQSEEGRFSEANRSSSEREFGIERKTPDRKQPPKDLASNALFFWKGDAHTHLAIERFEHFDGSKWLEASAASSPAKPTSLLPDLLEIEGQTWFFAAGDKYSSSLSPYRGASQAAAKFTRYGSSVIPSRCGTKLWSIDQISRPDFFSYSASDCISMPGREHVPDYTVVKFVCGEIDLQTMEKLLEQCSPGKGHVPSSTNCQSRLASLAHEYSQGTSRGWAQVNSVVQGLRSEFEYSRVSEPRTEETVVEQFLRTRSGPSYLFATTAALMLEHLGYETRLVTGFYVNSKHYIATDDEYAVDPSDAHVWLEINAGHGYWIPLEPTPGYRPPRYSASVWYRIFQARWHLLAGCLVASTVVAVLYVLRRVIFNLLCLCFAPALSLCSDRLRISWTAWMLDVRLSLLGHKRPPGAVLRKHLSDSLILPERLDSHIRTFLDASDSFLFGNRHTLSADQYTSIHCVWRDFPMASRKTKHIEEPS